MQAQKRISLNTSLRNARIFEEHSDDEAEHLTFDKLLNQAKEERQIKTELASIKVETPTTKVKTEPLEDLVESPKAVTFDLSLVKREKDEDSGLSISSAVAEMQLLTPVKCEKSDSSKPNLKSAKRSLLKQRNSPYAKEVMPTYATRSSTAMRDKEDNLYEQLETTKRNLTGETKKVVENDPAVLERRQKQIDYGKNTVGYDNYMRTVQKCDRKSDDPMTPNKHRVYSRRGFDGLIKQWRLKLHKYDPDQ